VPITEVVNIMRPFYQACGIDIEDLEAIVKDENGTIGGMDQSTVPAGSDLYFLGQILGKVRVVVDEVDQFTPDSILTKKGTNISADVVLKCLGSHTDDSFLKNIYGEDSTVQGLWINGDPNLFTYNDGAQVPRKVKSLMCSSYAFFVQAFVPAYINFRRNTDKFKKALSRIISQASSSTVAERIFVELWDFLEPAKRIVAERTRTLCPFDRFQIERENEWKAYSQMLSNQKENTKGLWELLYPTLSYINRRNPQAPIETRSLYSSVGKLSVFVPHRKKVLFLPGQGTNARLARTLLEQTGWIGRSHLDFVIPDAPFEMPAFTNEEQLKMIGLNGLVESGLYDRNAIYREWRAGFEKLYEHHKTGRKITFNENHKESWKTSLAYLSQILRQYGPVEGIAGFCEGATVASVAFHLQNIGKDLGLDNIRFFIAMSPWRSPMHEKEGLFATHGPIEIPMLQIVGKNDMDVFLDSSPRFLKDFKNPIEYWHNGQHVYPPFTPELENHLNHLLSVSYGSTNSIMATV